MVGRDEQRLEMLEDALKVLGVTVDTQMCNLESTEEVIALSKYAAQKNIDLLINCAGVHCPGKCLPDLELEKLQEIINVNLLAPLILVYEIYSLFSSKKDGTIININSMVGLETKKYRTAYSAAKWGLRGFSNSLRLEAQDLDVHILDVFPTRVKTTPEVTEAMEMDHVIDEIYAAFLEKKGVLVLDGRDQTERIG